MKVNTKKQLITLSMFLVIYALLAFVTYAFIPLEQLLPSTQMMPATPTPSIPGWLLGLANAGIVLLVYGVLGLIGYWFALRLELPKIYREEADWRNWFLWPMLIGLGGGIVMVVIDRFFAAAGQWAGMAHPPFPLSLIASATAGIGEEILFRSFVLGLWAFLLNLLLRHWQATQVALWVGNIIAALAFSAGHLPAVMLLLGVTSPSEIPVFVLAELALLNTFVGLVAGERYIRDGLVAAIGVHFWADVVWHVIWPLIGLQP
jgi:membrane protease YdiL (CAAX protease family)